MTRKLTIILLTSAGVLFGASACSDKDKPLPPVKAISSCDKNQVTTGGYFWTFTDAGKNTYGTVEPFTVWKGDGNPGNVSFAGTLSPIPEDPENYSCKIEGTKPADPVPGDEAMELKDSCGDTPRYPVAGIGFSFLDKNAPFSVCDKLGLRFRAKGVFINAVDSLPAATMSVRVGIPTMQTDLWEEGDKWAANATGQLCVCDHDLPAGHGDEVQKTCFGFWGLDIQVTADWQWFSMTWGEMNHPSWAGPADFIPTNVLKTQFTIESKDGDYSLEIDDVQFILAADGVDWCAQQLDITKLAVTDPVFCSLAAKDEPLCAGGEPEHF